MLRTQQSALLLSSAKDKKSAVSDPNVLDIPENTLQKFEDRQKNQKKTKKKKSICAELAYHISVNPLTNLQNVFQL